MRQHSLKRDDTEGRLVDVRPKFAVESVKPGGVKRTAALRQAENVIQSSRAELDERLCASIAALAELTSDLELKPSTNAKVIQTLRDHARQLRDFGSLAGFEMVTSIAAMLCDVLNGMMDGRLPFRVEVVRCFVDPLELFCCAEQRGVSTLETPELIAGLEAMQRKLLPDADQA